LLLLPLNIVRCALGEPCKIWQEASFTKISEEPMLDHHVGLDSNLCRNPDLRGSGPWCYDSSNRVRQCDLPRCDSSASTEHGEDTVATMEDEEVEPGQRAINGFQLHFGVYPKVDRSESFCGLLPSEMTLIFVISLTTCISCFRYT